MHHHHISHHILHDIAPHFTCSTSCIIPPHLTVIAPIGNSTAHYHVSHNVPHHPSVHHHFLHPTTCHISHNTTSTTTYIAVSQPTLYLIPHRTTFYISCHSTRTSPYYTTTFHNPIPVSEARNYMRSVLLFHSHTTYTTYQTQTKMVVKKCNFIQKVPEKVIPVCPN